MRQKNFILRVERKTQQGPVTSSTVNGAPLTYYCLAGLEKNPEAQSELPRFKAPFIFARTKTVMKHTASQEI